MLNLVILEFIKMDKEEELKKILEKLNNKCKGCIKKIDWTPGPKPDTVIEQEIINDDYKEGT